MTEIADLQELERDVQPDAVFQKLEVAKDRRRGNCRLPDVQHIFNVLGTMESCPTYFCPSPDGQNDG